jgi:hypothetical protein
LKKTHTARNKPIISFSNFPKKLTECSIFDPFILRLSIYKNITCLENFYLKWISLAPHTFLHAGFLSNLIAKNDLNSSPAISIGINLIQESILVKNNNLTIDIYDVDKEIIAAATKAVISLKIENSIKYKLENILLTGKIERNTYKLAILSQMDYVFDDEEIEKIASIFSENGIDDIFLLTPSVFQINKSPIKLLEAIFKFLYSMRSLVKNKNKQDTYRTYTRNITHLKKLFSNFYRIEYQTDYKYPYGRIFLLHLKKIKTTQPLP